MRMRFALVPVLVMAVLAGGLGWGGAAKGAGDRVLIFPFNPVNDLTETAWIGTAVQQDLQAELGRGGALQALAYPERFEKPDAGAAVLAGRKWHAAMVVFGSYQVIDTQVRVTGQVLNVDTARLLGTAKATGELRELLKTEDALSEQVRAIVTGLDGGGEAAAAVAMAPAAPPPAVAVAPLVAPAPVVAPVATPLYAPAVDDELYTTPLLLDSYALPFWPSTLFFGEPLFLGSGRHHHHDHDGDRSERWQGGVVGGGTTAGTAPPRVTGAGASGSVLLSAPAPVRSSGPVFYSAPAVSYRAAPALYVAPPVFRSAPPVSYSRPPVSWSAPPVTNGGGPTMRSGGGRR